MKAIIFYESRTGFTQRYAAWLAQALGCEAVPAAAAGKPDLSGYDTVIFASWLYAGSIKKLSWFKSLPLTGKRRVVLVTGVAPMDSGINGPSIEAAFKEDRKDYEIFYVTGGLNYEKMGLKDRMMMTMFRKMMHAKKDKTDLELEMAKALDHSFDAAKKEYLEPVIKSLMLNC